MTRREASSRRETAETTVDVRLLIDGTDWGFKRKRHK